MSVPTFHLPRGHSTVPYFFLFCLFPCPVLSGQVFFLSSALNPRLALILAVCEGPPTPPWPPCHPSIFLTDSPAVGCPTVYVIVHHPLPYLRRDSDAEPTNLAPRWCQSTPPPRTPYLYSPLQRHLIYRSRALIAVPSAHSLPSRGTIYLPHIAHCRGLRRRRLASPLPNSSRVIASLPSHYSTYVSWPVYPVAHCHPPNKSASSITKANLLPKDVE